jgi:peptidoglycan/xylan/chitin deacetylase (PgdA/CDA1 family)
VDTSLLAAAWHLPVRLWARRREDIVFFGRTDEPYFALTLDDGPDPAVTPQVLDLLSLHHAKATFFVIGSRAQAHPELIRRIQEDGHELGNHMWHDEPARKLSHDEFERSVLRTERVLGPDVTRLLRPGSGPIGREKAGIASRSGYRCVLGSVYPFDAQLRSGRWMSWLVRTVLRPGDIVVLHEGEASRVGVVPVLAEILSAANRRRLAAVSVGALLEQVAAERATRRPP